MILRYHYQRDLPRRVIAAITCSLLFACGSGGGNDAPDVQYEGTKSARVNYTPASRQSIATFLNCYDACAQDPANCDYGTSGLCFPNMSKVTACQDGCNQGKRCFPWDFGQQPGGVCRWSSDEHECNFTLCWQAAFDCANDCFRVYATQPAQNGMHGDCLNQCYRYFGCRPKKVTTCDPLPDGYVYCACPDDHGAECHPANHSPCP